MFHWAFHLLKDHKKGHKRRQKNLSFTDIPSWMLTKIAAYRILEQLNKSILILVKELSLYQ